MAVVEHRPQRYPLPRACTIDHEALGILQAAGVMADQADLFEPSQGARGGYRFRNGAAQHVDVPRLVSGVRAMLQPATEGVPPR